MPPVGFEPTTSAGERPQTYALDRAATGTDKGYKYQNKNIVDRGLILIAWHFFKLYTPATRFVVKIQKVE